MPKAFPPRNTCCRSGLLPIRARPCRADGQLHLLMNLNLMRSKMPCRNYTQKWGRPHPCPYLPVLHGHSSVSRRLWGPLPTGQRLHPLAPRHTAAHRTALISPQLPLGRRSHAKVLLCHQTPVCTWSVQKVPRGNSEEGLDSNRYLWFSFIFGGSLLQITPGTKGSERTS